MYLPPTDEEIELKHVLDRPKLRLLLLDLAYATYKFNVATTNPDYLNMVDHLNNIAGLIDDMNEAMFSLDMLYDISKIRVLLLMAVQGKHASLKSKLWQHTAARPVNE